MANLDFFDLQQYLESKGIEVWTEGSKNVSSGWIGIQCLWCSDDANHLGINLDGKGFKCWKCKEKGSIYKLIRTLENCDNDQVDVIIGNFQNPNIYLPEKKQIILPDSTFIPPDLSTELTQQSKDYLRSRGFNPEELIQKYGLMQGGITGHFKYRLVVPIIMDNRIVGLVGRDVTGQSEKRYKDSRKEWCCIHPAGWLYNADGLECSVGLVCEGIFDSWKLGNGAISTLGTEFTREKAMALIQKRFKKLYIIFDSEPEAQKNAAKYAHELSYKMQVEIIELEIKDPGMLTKEQAIELRRELQL